MYYVKLQRSKRRRNFMNLKEFLFYADMSAAKFARSADLTPSYISQVMRGNIRPTAKTLKVIVKATGDRIKPEDVCKPTRIPDEFLNAVQVA